VARPAVSICIPAYNGAEWIDAAIDSALAQTYTDFELLVVDDCSTDATRERVLARGDERLRLSVNDAPLGAVGNHNRCVDLAGGDLIKFLHQDDLLYPDCLEQMAAVFERQPTVGLVFAPRDVILDEPADPDAVEWMRRYGSLHGGFRRLKAFNRGADLLDEYLPSLRGPVYYNWIGEPSAVAVRRACFEQVGRFQPRMAQSFDIEMWLRILAVADVGFVSERLTAFRHHSRSLSATTAQSGKDWLDLLWLLEGVLGSPALSTRNRAMLRRFRRRELLRAFKRQAARIVRKDRDHGALWDYLAYRARSRRPFPTALREE
jgi:glycosyltransferase involved in cell wall biosynthesis